MCVKTDACATSTRFLASKWTLVRLLPEILRQNGRSASSTRNLASEWTECVVLRVVHLMSLIIIFRIISSIECNLLTVSLLYCEPRYVSGVTNSQGWDRISRGLMSLDFEALKFHNPLFLPFPVIQLPIFLPSSTLLWRLSQVSFLPKLTKELLLSKILCHIWHHLRDDW